jgi:hypothetical protein
MKAEERRSAEGSAPALGSEASRPPRLPFLARVPGARAANSPSPTTPGAVVPDKITRDVPVTFRQLGRGLRGEGTSAWTPPGGGRRLLASVLVLAAGALLARLWPHVVDPSAFVRAGAREVVGYRLGAATVSVALPPGTRLFKVLTNLDLPDEAPATGVPYVVNVRVREDGTDETFALLGRPARDAGGRIAGFFRDRAGTPARTAVLTLRRSSPLPATLELSLASPAGGATSPIGSLRVYVAHERIAAGPGRSRGPTVGGVALEDLEPDVRAGFLSQSWSRAPATALTTTRTFYLPAVDQVPPAQGLNRDQLVGAGHVLAVTLEGPGTVTLRAGEDDLKGRATLLYASGVERSVALMLRSHEDVSLALANGLCTLRIDGDAPARVALAVSSPAMIVRGSPPPPAADAVVTPVAGRRFESNQTEADAGPTWSWQSLARAEPGAGPVAFQAAGRRQAAFRVTAWVPLGDRPGPTPAEPILRWRFVDGRGRPLAEGKAAVDATSAPEDHLEGGAEPPAGGRLVSQPTTFYLWPPRAAQRLLIDADRPVDVAAASPGFDADPVTDDQETTLGPVADGLVVRHAPPPRQVFFPVRPINAVELQRAGRIDRLAGALRLERLPPRDKPKGPATSLGPHRDGGRFVALLPATEGGAPAHPGQLWTVRPQRDEVISVPRPRGTAGAARVPATLLYEIGRAGGRQPLLVRLDGDIVRRASLLGARGQIALPPLPVGKHRLRIEIGVAARLFLDQPVAGAAGFRRSQLYLLPAGAANVAVSKSRSPRALGVVMYLDRPASLRRPVLDVLVDRGVRRRGSGAASGAYTRLRRRVSLDFRRAPGAIFLNRSAPAIWASRPVFIPLGDDLSVGTHQVSIHARGLGARPMARFFSYGGPPVNRINQHIEINVDVAPDGAGDGSP